MVGDLYSSLMRFLGLCTWPLVWVRILADLPVRVQAFELHPTCGCHPAFDNKWVNCIYHFLGTLSVRRIV